MSQDSPMEVDDEEPSSLIRIPTTEEPTLLPTNVQLEFRKKQLVLTWSMASYWDANRTYYVRLIKSSGKAVVYKDSGVAEHSYTFPKDKYSPILYYFAEVGIESPRKTGVVLSNKIRLCREVDPGIFLDRNQRLCSQKEVYKGYTRGARGKAIEVAVKLIYCQSEDDEREIENLTHFDINPKENIVCFKKCGEIKEDKQITKTYYIVMELCQEDTLHEIVQKGVLKTESQRKKVLIHIMRGLLAIHTVDRPIIHRDLKPRNILRSLDGKTMKIADFGLSKQFKEGQSKVSKSKEEVGTEGWGSPEHYGYHNVASMTTKSDIYSAGLTFYFVLSNGKHAFGDEPYKWRAGIIEDTQITLPCLDCEEPWLARDLILSMLQRDPEQRPDASEVLVHPYFWTNVRKLQYIHYVKESIGSIPNEIYQQVRQDLEILEREMGDWYERLKISKVAGAAILAHIANGEEPLSDMHHRATYVFSRVKDLARFIRNMEEHFKNYPYLKRLFQNGRSDIWLCFSNIFPDLLIGLYKVFFKHRYKIISGEVSLPDLKEFFTTKANYEELQ